MTEPTSEEFVLISKFRNRVQDILETDEHKSNAFLIRWIRAREHDLNKAEDMLRNSIKYRKQNNLDALQNKKWDPFLAQHFPYYSDGFDRQGRPVVTYQFGKWDLRECVKVGLIDQFADYYTAYLEQVLIKMRERQLGTEQVGWPITQISAVVDCDGYSYGQLLSVKSMQAIMRIATTYEAHYPECLYRVYFVNCPKVFHLLFSIVKPALPPKTVTKLVVCGKNREEWIPMVREPIDPSQIRVPFGGHMPL